MNHKLLFLVPTIFVMGAAHAAVAPKESLVLDASCVANAPAKLVKTTASEIRLASYNVENLFDADHDEGKDDAEYLPIKNEYKERGCEEGGEQFREKCLHNDWTAEAFETKLDQMEAAFKAQYQSVDAYPDILVLVEVENPTSAMRFGERLGYTTKPRGAYPAQSTDYSELYKNGSVACQKLGNGIVMTNSPDKRGIDVVILYKAKKNIELVDCNETLVEKNKNTPTRNILAARFTVNGEPLTVLANHWPSQGAKTPARTNAAKVLKSLFAEYGKEGGVVAMGDYNTIENESPNPIEDTLLGDKKIVDVAGKNTHGTYYYGPNVQWNRLDRIFVNDKLRGAKAALKVDASTYLAHSQSALVKENKIWIFRDQNAVDKYEQDTGTKLKFYNFAATAQDARVAAKFKADKTLGVLEVTELCAPNRTYNYTDRNGVRQQGGYTDHFAVSVSLKN